MNFNHLVSMLELRHLKTLKALREMGSLVEAAEVLHLTQSALSHQIKDLEDRLNCTLFIRKTKPPRFTSAGRRLLALADLVAPEFKAAERDIARLTQGEAGRLHICIECHSCFQWLVPCIEAYRLNWPEVELDLIGGFSFTPLPALARGDLDLVITSDPIDLPDIHYEPLFEYEAMLAVSKRHPLSQKTFIDPLDLADQTLITYPVDRDRLDVFTQFLDPAGVDPRSIRKRSRCCLSAQLGFDRVLGKRVTHRETIVGKRPLGTTLRRRPPRATRGSLYARVLEYCDINLL